MSHNDITGDRLVSKASNDAYDKGYDAIFKKVVYTEKQIIDKAYVEVADAWESAVEDGEVDPEQTDFESFMDAFVEEAVAKWKAANVTA